MPCTTRHASAAHVAHKSNSTRSASPPAVTHRTSASHSGHWQNSHAVIWTNFLMQGVCIVRTLYTIPLGISWWYSPRVIATYVMRSLELQHVQRSRVATSASALERHHAGAAHRDLGRHGRREAARQDEGADQRGSAGGGECPMEANQGVGESRSRGVGGAGSRDVGKSGSQDGKREAEEVITFRLAASSRPYDAGAGSAFPAQVGRFYLSLDPVGRPRRFAGSGGFICRDGKRSGAARS
jgi:hypothetical protein